MLKVLHTGDWHIGSFPGPEVGGQNARFQDICRCLDFQAMYAEEHRPDIIVVSGDIFHQARVWSDRGLRESRTAIDHIRRLSNVAPAVMQELRHVIKCKRMLRLCETVLNSSDGLPIGNYTSQWFANFLLQRLDHFIKEVLHIRYFVRYMDDMCLWASSKKLLHRAVKAIEKFLAGLGLVLKANWQIFPTAARAVDFLGFRFFREKTTLRKNLALRLRRRVKKTYKHTQKTGRVRARDAAAVMSYCGWLKHAHCHGFFVKYVKPYVNFKKLKEAIRHEARIRARTAYCVGNAAQPRTV